jgi:4-azaleucine resistance transporter AzlC
MVITSTPLRSAWSQAFPVILGYIPIGFAFGLLAQNAGLSPANTLAMSVLVYAGSAQLIAVGLFASGVSPLSIILTTWIVNLRHMLMAAALSPYLKLWRRALLPLFAFQLTDETFGLHSTRFAQAGAQPKEALAVNVVSQAAWVSGTILGIIAGNLIQDVRPFGLDYALVAMFIALLVFQIRRRLHIAIAAVAGILSLALLQAGFGQWNVIIATVIAASIGVWMESWIKTRSFSQS